jgi:Periplasmic binding protein-like domain
MSRTHAKLDGVMPCDRTDDSTVCWYVPPSPVPVDTMRRYACWPGRTAPPPSSSAVTFRRSGCCGQSGERGLDVPGDIAVVIFDGIEESAFSWPPLTLTQQPLQAMAEAAISALLSGNDAAHDLFPMELIIRQSCGCMNNGGHSA